MLPIPENEFDNAESAVETRKRADDLFRRAEKASKDWHQYIEKARKLYDMKHYDHEPLAGEFQYSDPTPTNVVDLAIGILPNDVDWRAVGWQPGEEEEHDTSQIEKFLTGLLEVNSRRIGYYLPYETKLHFCRDGAAVLYSVWDNEVAQETFQVVPQADPNSPTGVVPVGLYEEPPIRADVIDPLQIFLLPGPPKRWNAIIRVIEMSVKEVEEIYGVRIKKFDYLRDDEQRRSVKGKLKDIWCYVKKDITLRMNPVMGQPETVRKWVVQQALLFDDAVIWPFRDMSGYDDLPFDVGFFKPTSRDASIGWGQAITKPMEDTLKLLERLTNRRTRQIDMFTNLPLITRSQTGRAVKLDASFGEAVPLTGDEGIEFVHWPGNAPDVEMHLSFLRARLQQSGFSDVLFSQGPSQVAGYALSQMSDQNRIRLEPPVRHLEILWASWAKKVLHLVSVFGKGSVVRVYGRLKGKDFAEQIVTEKMDQYLVQARIRPKFPNDEVRKTAMAVQAKPFLPTKVILERYLDVEQPDDVYDEWLIEMAQKSPEMMAYGARAALIEMAQAGDAAAAMTLEAMQAQAIGPGRGRPEGQQNTPQLTGTAGPEGQPPAQAAGAEPPGQSTEDQLQALTQQAPGYTD